MLNEPTFIEQGISMLWKASNFTTTVFLTSGVITLGHSPLNSLMRSLAEGNTPTSYIKFPVFIRSLYAGSLPYLLGTSSRTMVMCGAKTVEHSVNNPAEESLQTPKLIFENNETSSSLFVRFAAITAFSFSDYLVGQLPEVLSLTQNAGLKVNWTTPHNLTKLYATGGVSRFCFGSIYIGALCEAEKSIAPHMPFTNQTVNYVVAGMLSGAVAAYASYPFSRVRDDRIAKLTAVDGKLTGPTLSQYTHTLLSHIRDAGIKETLTYAIKDFFIQGNLRAIRGAYRFAVIVAMAELCGEEPLGFLIKKNATISSDTIGFFAKTSKESARLAAEKHENSIDVLGCRDRKSQ